MRSINRSMRPQNRRAPDTRTNLGVALFPKRRPTLSVLLAIELETAAQRIAKQKVAQTEVRANPRGNRTRRARPDIEAPGEPVFYGSSSVAFSAWLTSRISASDKCPGCS